MRQIGARGKGVWAELVGAIELASRGGKKVAVGVSGGADSVVLAEVAWRMGVKPVVFHFNHRWRGRVGDADERWVKAWGKKRGLRVVVGRAKRAGRTGEGEARMARWAFFQQAALKCKVGELWLAHHSDDQAETVLMQLLRGAGPDGLAGMAIRSKQSGLDVVRPLLGLSRDVVRRAAREEGLRWREDQTNHDGKGWRSRVRQKVLPYLSKMYGREVRGALCRAAEILAGEREYWEKEIGKIPSHPDVREWRKKAVAWQRRAIRIWLGRQGYGGPSFAEVEGTRRLILAESTATCQLGRSLLVKRKKGRLFLGKGLPIRLV